MKYTLLSLSGDDRVSFLQGQLTQDIDRLETGFSLPAAWCNPKGRVLLTCRLLGADDRVLMAVPQASTAAAMQRLSMYRLRAKVEIKDEPDWQALAFAGNAAQQVAGAIGLADDTAQHWLPEIHALRLPGPGNVLEVLAAARAIEALGIDPARAMPEPEWDQARIAAGLADIDTSNAERYTPHMLNLDLTGALNFDKGCYTGQEVVARTQHLGKVKRRVAGFRIGGGQIKVGDKLTLAGEDIAEVVNAAGQDVLAIAPISHIGRPLQFSGHPAEPLELPYVIGRD